MTMPNKPAPAGPPSTATSETGQIWMDGELVPTAEARISVLTHALHYGTSVFEGIRVYRTERGPAIFRLHEHARRLIDSARILLMRSPVSAKEVADAIVETVRANDLQSGYVRPLLWYGAESLGINPDRNRTHFMVATMPWGSYLGDEVVKQGAKLMTSSWRRSPGDVMPTKSKAGGNYINSVLANQEARENGFDEALLLDRQGYVAEGSGENVFFFMGDVLYPIAHSVNLRGITRDSIIQIARSMGTEVVPTMATRDELYIADELFLVGTAAEVTPVASLDRRPIGNGRAGERTLELRQRYQDVVTGKVPEFDKWLTYVNG